MGIPSHSTLRALGKGLMRAGAVPRAGVWHWEPQPVAHTPWGLDGCHQLHTRPGTAAVACPELRRGTHWALPGGSWASTTTLVGWTWGLERAGRAVPVSGGVQASPQPEKQHLCSPGQSRSSVQRLGQAAALLWARFRGQNPGLAAGKEQGLACSQPGPTAHGSPTVQWGLRTPGAVPGHPQPGMGISRTPHLAQQARSGCSSRGCSTSPPSGMWCRCDILSHSLAQWHCQHGGSSPGSLQREMLHAAVSQGAGLTLGHQYRHQPTSHPLPDPCAGIPWSEQRYLWRAGGRSRPSRSGSTSQHQGSHGRRGSRVWAAKGLRSSPPGTRLLWEGRWGSSVLAGPGVGIQGR